MMASNTPNACCPLSILLVEDNRDAAQTIAFLLQISGHEVTVAYDGPTALQKAESSLPDVVLLDIGLPKMDGWQLAKALRQRSTPKRPLIIAITGYGDKAARQRSSEAGIDLHLLKPVDFDELMPLIAKRVSA
jgi:CheY-like chemotaxis protein